MEPSRDPGKCNTHKRPNYVENFKFMHLMSEYSIETVKKGVRSGCAVQDVDLELVHFGRESCKFLSNDQLPSGAPYPSHQVSPTGGPVSNGSTQTTKQCAKFLWCVICCGYFSSFLCVLFKSLSQSMQLYSRKHLNSVREANVGEKKTKMPKMC